MVVLIDVKLPFTVKSPSIVVFPLTTRLSPILTSDVEWPIFTAAPSVSVLMLNEPFELLILPLVPSWTINKSPESPKAIWLPLLRDNLFAVNSPETETLLVKTSEEPVRDIIVLSYCPAVPWSLKIEVTPDNVLISKPSPRFVPLSLTILIDATPPWSSLDLIDKDAESDSIPIELTLVKAPPLNVAVPSVREPVIDRSFTPETLESADAITTFPAVTAPSTTPFNLFNSPAVDVKSKPLSVRLAVLNLLKPAISLLSSTTIFLPASTWPGVTPANLFISSAIADILVPLISSVSALNSPVIVRLRIPVKSLLASTIRALFSSAVPSALVWLNLFKSLVVLWIPLRTLISVPVAVTDTLPSFKAECSLLWDNNSRTWEPSTAPIFTTPAELWVKALPFSDCPICAILLTSSNSVPDKTLSPSVSSPVTAKLVTVDWAAVKSPTWSGA